MSDPKTISDALGVPFPRSAIKEHPQTKLSYVAGHTYIHRLNDATGNTWDWRIVRQDFHPYGATGKGNARLLITVIGELTIPGLGTRAGMGVQVVTADTGGEDMWKGAMTDAIKGAAKLFGVGLELYGPDYEAGEMPALPERSRTTSQNTLPQGTGSPVTNDAQGSASDIARASQGQLNVIAKHQKDLGWSDDDMALMARAKGRNSLTEFTTEEAKNLIHFMADPEKAGAYLAKRRAPQQGEMIPTTDIAGKARQ